eukprot:COSAG01_NODE_2132_length_8354_cov_19.152271_3_plen_204_part_00
MREQLVAVAAPARRKEGRQRGRRGGHTHMPVPSRPPAAPSCTNGTSSARAPARGRRRTHEAYAPRSSEHSPRSRARSAPRAAAGRPATPRASRPASSRHTRARRSAGSGAATETRRTPWRSQDRSPTRRRAPSGAPAPEPAGRHTYNPCTVNPERRPASQGNVSPEQQPPPPERVLASVPAAASAVASEAAVPRPRSPLPAAP